MYDDNFDRDIDRDRSTVFYDETEAKNSYYNTRRRSNFSGTPGAINDGQSEESIESKRASTPALVIAFVSLMLLSLFYFIVGKNLMFICGIFPSIGGIISYCIDNKSKLSKWYLGLSILGSVIFLLGILVLIIDVVRM